MSSQHFATIVIDAGSSAYFALAIKHGIKAAYLAEFLWAYPTYSSDLKYMVK
jgi:pyruvate/2-oxoglutarate dehydrogenase complex dihydrolipoamide dehydrogenase (E3) component